MAFYEVRFPVGVSYGAVGGSGYSTKFTESDGGFTRREAFWPDTRGRWAVAHEVRNQDDWMVLIALHRLTQGKLHGFRFKDWSDFTAKQGEGWVRGDEFGNYRLTKSYTFTDLATGGMQTMYRWITKPVPGTIIFDPPRSTTVDYINGMTIGAEGNDAWSGEFDVAARFDVDIPQLSYDNEGALGGIASWHGIEIVELLKRDIESLAGDAPL